MSIKVRYVGTPDSQSLKELQHKEDGARWFLNQCKESLTQTLSSDEKLIKKIISSCTMSTDFYVNDDQQFDQGDMDFLYIALENIIKDRVNKRIFRRDIGFWEYFQRNIQHNYSYRLGVPILEHKKKHPEFPYTLADYMAACCDAMDIAMRDIINDYELYQSAEDKDKAKIQIHDMEIEAGLN